MTEQAIDLVVCPECGAGNAPHERRCWLCGGPIDSASKSRQASAGLNAAGHAVLTVSLTVIAATYVLICIGVWQEAPGLSLGLLAIVLPPMIATAIASFRGRRRGKPLGLGEKTLKFMIWFSIVLGLIGLTAVAAAVAFCIWCFAELARKS